MYGNAAAAFTRCTRVEFTGTASHDTAGPRGMPCYLPGTQAARALLASQLAVLNAWEITPGAFHTLKINRC